MIDTFDGLDLDAERAVRAASREGRGQTYPIRLGGGIVATLPTELPVDVLAPLRALDGDLTLILRQAMEATKGGANARMDATELVVDVLIANPSLPVTAIDIVRDVAVNLLGQEGFAALLAARPSSQDYAALIKGVFRFYGLTLGEALPSSDSSTDVGATSSTTSSENLESTPEDSGPPPAHQGSWEPVGS
jgi:hypothetical protein